METDKNPTLAEVRAMCKKEKCLGYPQQLQNVTEPPFGCEICWSEGMNDYDRMVDARLNLVEHLIWECSRINTRLVSQATDKTYYNFLRKQKANRDRFQKLIVEAMTRTDTEKMVAEAKSYSEALRRRVREMDAQDKVKGGQE